MALVYHVIASAPTDYVNKQTGERAHVNDGINQTVEIDNSLWDSVLYLSNNGINSVYSDAMNKILLNNSTFISPTSFSFSSADLASAQSYQKWNTGRGGSRHDCLTTVCGATKKIYPGENLNLGLAMTMNLLGNADGNNMNKTMQHLLNIGKAGGSQLAFSKRTIIKPYLHNINIRIMKFLLRLFVIIVFIISCKDKKEDKKQNEIKESKPLVTEVKAVEKDNEIDNCFESLFNKFLKGYKVEKTKSLEITRKGVLDCFLKNNKNSFSKLNMELLFKLSDSISKKEIINIKKMIFTNKSIADEIFISYSKGFYNDCIAIKEPNFIIKENNIVYVFFARAEYYRNKLKDLKKILQDDIFYKCPNIKQGECR